MGRARREGRFVAATRASPSRRGDAGVAATGVQDTLSPRYLGKKEELPRGFDVLLQGLLDHHAQIAEALVAAFEQILDLRAFQRTQRLGDVLVEAVGGGVRVAMGAAE